MVEDAWQSLLSLFGAGTGAGGGAFAWWQSKANKKDLEELEALVKDKSDSISDLRVHLASNYMKRAEILNVYSEIKNSLQRIEDKLDGKADK